MELPDKLCEAEDGPVLRALPLHPGEVLQVVWAGAAGPCDRGVARRGLQPTTVFWKQHSLIKVTIALPHYLPFLMCLRSDANCCKNVSAGTVLNCRWYSGFRMASVLNVSVTYLWKYVGNGSSESRSYTNVLKYPIFRMTHVINVQCD